MAYYCVPDVLYYPRYWEMEHLHFPVRSPIPATDPAIWEVPTVDSPQPAHFYNQKGCFHPVNETATAASPAWDLPQDRQPSVENKSRVTPEIFAAAQEMKRYLQVFGVPAHVVLTNFVNYIQRNALVGNTENFLFYLKNWAHLDIRVGLLDVEEGKEAQIEEIQQEPVKVEVRNGTTFFVIPTKPKVARDWPKSYSHDDFLKMKKAAEEEFEESFHEREPKT